MANGPIEGCGRTGRGQSSSRSEFVEHQGALIDGAECDGDVGGRFAPCTDCVGDHQPGNVEAVTFERRRDRLALGNNAGRPHGRTVGAWVAFEMDDRRFVVGHHDRQCVRLVRELGGVHLDHDELRSCRRSDEHIGQPTPKLVPHVVAENVLPYVLRLDEGAREFSYIVSAVGRRQPWQHQDRRTIRRDHHDLAIAVPFPQRARDQPEADQFGEPLRVVGLPQHMPGVDQQVDQAADRWSDHRLFEDITRLEIHEYR